MSCIHYNTCPLFKYFASHPVLNLWRVHYCNKSDNNHCVRYQQTVRGIPNAVSLLPNGKHIETAPLALLNAVQKNRVHLLLNILENIDIDIDFQNIDGMSALMIAAQQGNSKIVNLLLQHGANPDLKNYDDETAYEIALRNRQKDIATLFREPLMPA